MALTVKSSEISLKSSKRETLEPNTPTTYQVPKPMESNIEHENLPLIVS